MYIKARQWIREAFVVGSRPTLKKVEGWVRDGHVCGEVREDGALIDADAERAKCWWLDRPPAGNSGYVPAVTYGYVYLIEALDTGRVKIGFSTAPERRLKEIRTVSPVELVLVATISGSDLEERRMHIRHYSRRLHGEWFEDCPEIRAEFGL